MWSCSHTVACRAACSARSPSPFPACRCRAAESISESTPLVPFFPKQQEKQRRATRLRHSFAASRHPSKREGSPPLNSGYAYISSMQLPIHPSASPTCSHVPDEDATSCVFVASTRPTGCIENQAAAESPVSSSYSKESPRPFCC